MSEFTCPKCGGHYFGRNGKTDSNGMLILEDEVTCHSMADGSACCMIPESIEYRRRNGLTTELCKWRGVWPPKESS